MSERKLEVICVTGDICSGKSLLAKTIAKKINAHYLNVDKIVTNLYSRKEKGYKVIKKRLGNKYINKINVDKKVILEDLLNKSISLEHVDLYVQPLVKKQLLKSLKKYRDDRPVVVEMGSFKNQYKFFSNIFSFVILVECELELKITRLMKRTNISSKKAHNIIKLFSNNEFSNFNIKVSSNDTFLEIFQKIEKYIKINKPNHDEKTAAKK